MLSCLFCGVTLGLLKGSLSPSSGVVWLVTRVKNSRMPRDVFPPTLFCPPMLRSQSICVGNNNNIDYAFNNTTAAAAATTTTTNNNNNWNWK